MGSGGRLFRRHFDEAAILTTLGKVAWQTEPHLTADDQAVLAALQRSTQALEDAGLDEIQAYLQGFDEAGLRGVISNTKGILHEMRWVELENAEVK